jgi:hypothetical protein
MTVFPISSNGSIRTVRNPSDWPSAQPELNFLKKSRLKTTNAKPKISKSDRKTTVHWLSTAKRLTLYANNCSVTVSSKYSSSSNTGRKSIRPISKYSNCDRLMTKKSRPSLDLSKRLIKDSRSCKPKSQLNSRNWLPLNS